MAHRESLSRRDFTKLVAAGALTPEFLMTSGHPPTHPPTRPPWSGYDRAVVVDCLASPGPFNVANATESPLSAEMLANARASGITGVNVTVSIGGFGETFRAMGYWERELGAHPDVLMKVQSVADLRRAKEGRRLGEPRGLP